MTEFRADWRGGGHVPAMLRVCRIAIARLPARSQRLPQQFEAKASPSVTKIAMLAGDAAVRDAAIECLINSHDSVVNRAALAG
jgi:hypothetical protein